MVNWFGIAAIVNRNFDKFVFLSLIQAILGHIPVAESSLQMDAAKMIHVADRVLKGMSEYFRCEQFPRKCFTAVQSTLILSKSVASRTWCDMTNFYRYLNVTEGDSAQLLDCGFSTITMLLRVKPQDIENVC